MKDTIRVWKTKDLEPRQQAIKELEAEKIKRRKLYETDREAWAKYKEETKEKIKRLNLIISGK